MGSAVLDDARYQGQTPHKLYRGGDLLYNKYTNKGQRDTSKEYGFIKGIYADRVNTSWGASGEGIAVSRFYVYIPVEGVGRRYYVNVFRKSDGQRVTSREFELRGNRIRNMAMVESSLFTLESDDYPNFGQYLRQYQLRSKSLFNQLKIDDENYTYESFGVVRSRSMTNISSLVTSGIRVWLHDDGRLYEFDMSLRSRNNYRRCRLTPYTSIAMTANSNTIYSVSRNGIDVYKYHAFNLKAEFSNEYIYSSKDSFDWDDKTGGQPLWADVSGTRLYTTYQSHGRSGVWNCYRI